ncbi:hypothetical protein DYB32_000464 [Aphanomyces invadans]|uniref:Uncharacterized protein n=1 Tax=Aphanomyces invadans TaxID=157072 RepID=A0A3R6WTZ5_9STRA|nr:hypothetical protein DYB32_000464 [Aphanomyces invadans]
MDAELKALEADLTRVQKAKAMALAQIDILMMEQKALQAKLDADRLQRLRAEERDARIKAAMAVAVPMPITVVSNEAASPPKVDDVLQDYVGDHEIGDY